MKKLRIVLITLLSLFAQHIIFAQEYFLYSPDSKLTFKLNVGTTVKYAVSVNGNTIISPSVIGCTTDFLQNMPLKVLATKKGIVKSQPIYPVVHQKKSNYLRQLQLVNCFFQRSKDVGMSGLQQWFGVAVGY